MNIAFLLVTCCLEQSRTEILSHVVQNLCEQNPILKNNLTVFDNASTDTNSVELLKANFDNVYRADKNVGYWSAIDWWLTTVDHQQKYIYIIESDMIHYDFDKILACESFLEKHPDVGSVRLHEYSVKNKHLYNKDAPLPESKRTTWQSHTNKITGQPIHVIDSENDIYVTNFLTQLPALNRYETMKTVFNKLKTLSEFSELDFQRLYHNVYDKIAILDGGIFHCNLSMYETQTLTGSWSSRTLLEKFGYLRTRQSTIIPLDKYNVIKI